MAECTFLNWINFRRSRGWHCRGDRAMPGGVSAGSPQKVCPPGKDSEKLAEAAAPQPRGDAVAPCPSRLKAQPVKELLWDGSQSCLTWKRCGTLCHTCHENLLLRTTEPSRACPRCSAAPPWAEFGDSGSESDWWRAFVDTLSGSGVPCSAAGGHWA